MNPVEGIRVRTATADDANPIAGFNSSLARESEGLALGMQIVQKGVRAVIDDPGKGFYLLAEYEDEIVGQLMITKEWSDWRCTFFWWLQSVYVLPSSRGRGVFRALFDHVCAMARDDNVRGLRLYVHDDNEQAIKIYEHLRMQRSHYGMLEMDLS